MVTFCRWVKSSWLLTFSICGRAILSPFNDLDEDKPWGPCLCRSWQIGLRVLQYVFSARKKLSRVSQGKLFWQPTVSWDRGNVCMFSKEQIWFQWSSDDAHASCASCLHQARPRACSAYNDTWQGLCQGFLLLWQVMGLSWATGGSPDDSLSRHYQGGWWNFIQLSLYWLLHSFFLWLTAQIIAQVCVCHICT